MPKAKKRQPVVTHNSKFDTNGVQKRRKKKAEGGQEAAQKPKKQPTKDAKRRPTQSPGSQSLTRDRSILRCTNVTDRQAASCVKALVEGDVQVVRAFLCWHTASANIHA